MTTATLSDLTFEIGETAGEVWHVLSEGGSCSIADLIKKVDAPRDTVMQAVGWLAREEKIVIEQAGRKKIVELV
jgi:uncharacterized membrane protein